MSWLRCFFASLIPLRIRTLRFKQRNTLWDPQTSYLSYLTVICTVRWYIQHNAQTCAMYKRCTFWFANNCGFKIMPSKVTLRTTRFHYRGYVASGGLEGSLRTRGQDLSWRLFCPASRHCAVVHMNGYSNPVQYEHKSRALPLHQTASSKFSLIRQYHNR